MVECEEYTAGYVLSHGNVDIVQAIDGQILCKDEQILLGEKVKSIVKTINLPC